MKSLFKNPSFRFFLTLSFFLHIGLVLLAFVFSNSLLFQSTKTALMIESAIQIDQIGLSDLKKISSKSVKNTRTLPSFPKSKIKEAKPKRKAEKPKKSPQKKEINLKKPDQNNSKNNKAEEQEKKNQSESKLEEEKQKDLDSKEEESLKESENQEISNETSDEISSDEANSDSSQLNSEQISEISYYANQILRQIRQNWNIPSYLTNKALTTQVEIKINSQGRLIYKQIILSSEDDLYDSFVLKTIEKGSPYLRPSPSVQKIIQRGIVLNVPSQ